MDFIGQFVNQSVGAWGYYAVFGLLAAEGFGLFFVPGETALIAAAVIAGATHQLSIIYVLLAGYLGALLGDNFAFLVGHTYGFGLLRRYGHKVRLNEKRLKFVQYLYLRYGAPIVFVGRFIMYLRSWESFLAGANAMKWRRFFPVNATATLAWVCAWGLGAYALGHASQILLEAIGFGVFGLFLVLFAIGWMYFRRHEAALEAKADAALPGPLRKHRPEEVQPRGGHAEQPARNP